MSPPSTQIPGYELIRELGSGGMANVYLAVQRSLDRKVALKVMKRNIEDLEKFEKRFLMEGRTMAKLPHRNIVAVYDIVKSEDATYIAMEYLDGGTLSQKMKEGLSLAEAISVVVQIAQALQFAHDHGIVHRDLKPANIMFRDENTPVLTDFGIAKQQDSGATRLTQTGMLVGTPTYMSPEQINALEVDGRSDLYSLGVLFYELLTGSPPFVAETPIAVLMAHLTTPPPPLPQAFADFQPVLDRTLAKNRDDRFANLKDFTRALKAAVVQNQNLWARLQADPNQSSSEQLRALGFSISGPQSENFTNPAVSSPRLPPPGRPAPRTPPSQPTPSPVSMRLPEPGGAPSGPVPAPRRAPWIAIGAGALVAVALGLGIAFWPRADIDPAIRSLVDSRITEVRGHIGQKQLDQARSALQAVQELAPRYEATRSVTAELAAAFEAEAEAALAARDFDAAMVRLAYAREFAPEDLDLVALEQRIESGRKAAAAAAQLASLFAKAEAAERRGRDLGTGGAYAILGEARQLAPQDPQVAQRMQALLGRVLAPARDALARGELERALAAVRASEGELAQEPAWRDLKGEVDRAIEAQALRVRVGSVLASLDQQLARGKLVEPPGDNARETLLAALDIDRANPEVLKRQTLLAQALAVRARQDLDAGRIEAALQGANDALAVKADLAEAQTLKRTAEGRLDARATKLIETLGAARQALAEQRFLEPAQPNARALIREVLQLDPGNTEAQRLLGELPNRIAEAARAHAADGDLDGAIALAEAARAAYPGDPQFATLSRDYTQQRTAAQARAARNARFERIAQLVATRPFTAQNAGAAAKEIGELLRLDPRDLDAATQKTRLFEAIGELVSGATATAEVDTAEAALKQVQMQFATDPAAQRLAQEIQGVRQRLAAEEKARLAAISGELVLNASPWATVESVMDADRRPVTLPADATTPLRLTLPQGVYSVTFRHPRAGRPATAVARVQAKQTVTTTASFATSVTSKDYLQRAGW